MLQQTLFAEEGRRKVRLKLTRRRCFALRATRSSDALVRPPLICRNTTPPVLKINTSLGTVLVVLPGVWGLDTLHDGAVGHIWRAASPASVACFRSLRVFFCRLVRPRSFSTHRLGLLRTKFEIMASPGGMPPSMVRSSISMDKVTQLTNCRRT